MSARMVSTLVIFEFNSDKYNSKFIKKFNYFALSRNINGLQRQLFLDFCFKLCHDHYGINDERRNMSVETIKNEMLTMSQEELSMIIHYAQRIKTVSATATFSVGQEVIVIQKTKRRAGVILKMNAKKAVVRMPWQGRTASVSVPYAMLEAA